MSSLTKRQAWGVAIVAILVLLSPVFLIAFLMADNFLRALFSPTRDAVVVEPTRNALAGTYVSLAATLTLRADQTFEVTNLPSFDMEGERQSCEWNGVGRWTLHRSSLGLLLTDSSRAHGKINCSEGTQDNSFVVLGQQPPYKLYLVIGDPDSGEGLDFVRTAR